MLFHVTARPGLVVAAAVGSLCRHAAAAAGACRRARRPRDMARPTQPAAGLARWTASAACASRRAGSAADRAARFRQDRAVAQPSARALRRAGRRERAQRGERATTVLAAARRLGRPMQSYARRARHGAGSPICWRSRCCCCCLDALMSLWLRGYLPRLRCCARRGGAARAAVRCCMPQARAPTTPST